MRMLEVCTEDILFSSYMLEWNSQHSTSITWMICRFGLIGFGMDWIGVRMTNGNILGGN